MTSDILYYLRRAETEAVRAVACDSARVAAVHFRMCILYANQAIAWMLATVPNHGGGSVLADLPAD